MADGVERPAEARVDQGILRTHLALVSTDNAWQQRARLLQSLWRQDHGWAPGSKSQDYEDPSAERLGSRLTVRDGDDGRNFFTVATHRAAVEAEHGKEKHALLGKARLLRDLLSSQPLCFNLFAELDQHPDLAVRVLNRLLPHLAITSLSGPIGYEHSPGRGNPAYSGDKSAFDVVIRYRSGDRTGMLGIEVKYHENLEQKEKRQHDFRPWFPHASDETLRLLGNAPLAQFARDHRLARAVAKVDREQYEAGVTWIMMYPAMNTAVDHAFARYRTLTPDARDRIPLTIEAFVAACQLETDDLWPAAVRARYLDTDRLDALGVPAQTPRPHESAWWAERPVESTNQDAAQFDRACWQRWWLASQLHRRWYRKLGVEIEGAFFAPMDGDLYSLPVWSPNCRIAPRYFGRLSRGAVHIDPQHATILGLPPAAETAAQLELPEGHSQHIVMTTEKALGLTAERGHQSCPHANDGQDYPTAWLLALLVRTIGGSSINTGRQLIQMTGDQPLIRPLIEHHRQQDHAGHWLAVLDGETVVMAAHPNGVAIAPDLFLNHRALGRQMPLGRIAAELDPTNRAHYSSAPW